MATFHIIGDAFVDLFCFLKAGAFPEPGGDAELTDPVQALAGGSGVNTATHLQSLCSRRHNNNDTTTLSTTRRVSLYTSFHPHDDYGAILASHAHQQGFRLINCRQPTSMASTGHCLAIVTENERSFMTHRGCIAEFSPESVDIQPIVHHQNDSVHIHVAGFYNMPLFWNDRLKNLLLRIRQERLKLNVDNCTLMSLVPQHDASNQWDGGLDDIVSSSCLDLLILNELEAKSIVARGSRLQASETTTTASTTNIQQETNLDDWIDYFTRLSSKTIFVITRGKDGAVAFYNGKIIAELAQSAKVNVVDPTGAGDAFTGGFIEGLWAWKVEHDRVDDNDFEWPLPAVEYALMRGCAAGSAVVQIRGASVPVPDNHVQQILDLQK
jgi:sugar/nucleoside kinase (ribokinase family)